MSDRDPEPIAQEAYDELAEAFAALVDTKPHNAYYERPATLSLLPPVRGQRVLDAGCGPGVYSQWLVDHGADVLAVDANLKMVQLARERLGSRAQVVQANLEQPLRFLASGSFDGVLSPLVLDYLREWAPLLQECHRLLRPGGWLVFSIEHPCDKFQRNPDGNYHQVELMETVWRGFGKPVRVPSYRRPMSAVLDPLLAAGFMLERLLEPVPTDEFRREKPEDYFELTRRPGFLCVRAAKPAAVQPPGAPASRHQAGLAS
jgi:SAM-dependent methyltransferase